MAKLASWTQWFVWPKGRSLVLFTPCDHQPGGRMRFDWRVIRGADIPHGTDFGWEDAGL